MRQAAGDLVESLALFDVWRDVSLGSERRSLAFRLRLRAPDRTLTDAEVARVRERVAAAVSAAAHGGEMRAGDARALPAWRGYYAGHSGQMGAFWRLPMTEP